MALRNFTLPLVALLTASLGGAALAAGIALETPPPPGPGLDLINQRCGFCHTPAQATGVRKTPAAWAAVVQSMIDRGAELSPDEQKTVVDYLSKNNAASPDAPGATAVPPAPAAAPTHS